MATINEIEVLAERIARLNKAYRQGSPEVSDAEYDAEVEKLRELDPFNDWFFQTEPAPVGESRKVSLPIPMKSLNKAKSVHEIMAWYNQFALNHTQQIVITPKFDGLSLLVNEQTGMAYSRGGADNEGQNCKAHIETANIKRDSSKCMYTFGEFVFSCVAWNNFFAGRINEDTGEKYKSPRNTAAGMLNRDIPIKQLLYVDFYRYGTDPHSLQQFENYVDLYTYLARTYDQEPLYNVCKVEELTEEYLLSLYKEWRKRYYIDGLVIYINNTSLWEKIGRHSTTGNPLYAIAYKHPDFTESFETTVKDIAWKVSKSGALKPVVNIEVVDTGDCQMENPTGYNASWIADMGIAPGAKILVTRSGGVIPKILQTLTPASDEEQYELWDDMTECPHCGSPTAWNSTHKELMCTNPNCWGVRLAKNIFFFTVCGVENMGEEMFNKLFDAGYRTILSILNITFDEICEIETFADGTANIILENMKRIKAGVDLPTLMQASDCFSGIGKVKAQKLIDSLTPEQLNKLYDPYYIEESARYHAEEATSEMERSFWNGYNSFKQFVQTNRLMIIKPAKIEIDVNGQFANMAICFSGIRDAELETRIIAGGGSIASGVSKKTTLLVVKDVNGTSGKISKAHQLGVPVMSMDDFKLSHS